MRECGRICFWSKSLSSRHHKSHPLWLWSRYSHRRRHQPNRIWLSSSERWNLQGWSCQHQKISDRRRILWLCFQHHQQLGTSCPCWGKLRPNKQAISSSTENQQGFPCQMLLTTRSMVWRSKLFNKPFKQSHIGLMGIWPPNFHQCFRSPYPCCTY